MKIPKILPLFGLVLMLSSCGPVESENSLLADKNVMFDPGLIGAWAGQDDEEVVTFGRVDARTYRVVYLESSGSEPLTFEGRLGRVAHLYFLDLHLRSGNESGHLFLRLSRDGEILSLAYLNYDWVRAMLTSGESKLDYRIRDEEIVLTASTGELQRFVMQHAGQKEAFSEVAKFKRQR
jgi:hypothetical protein